MSHQPSFLRRHVYPRFSGLERWARRVKAKADSTKPEREYAEFGLDTFLIEQLTPEVTKGQIYVEVGGNHPINMSNTYRLYRHGMRGYIIEPNATLVELHRMIRPGDSAVQCGCGAEAGIVEFVHLPDHENSYIRSAGQQIPTDARIEVLPIVKVDEILKNNTQPIFFMSVDTEGYDIEVLRGATETLKRTNYLCVEMSSDGAVADEEALKELLSGGFEIEKTFGNNRVYRRRMTSS
jgi:FkbM family methyltransferase